jgi:hypothetical protein
MDTIYPRGLRIEPLHVLRQLGMREVSVWSWGTS